MALKKRAFQEVDYKQFRGNRTNFATNENRTDVGFCQGAGQGQLTHYIGGVCSLFIYEGGRYVSVVD